MFEQLDFIYQPSRDASADLAFYESALGAEVVFAIERFGTRVAMVRLAPDAPGVLLAEHLEGDAPILVFRVSDLDESVSGLVAGGCTLAGDFEMPFGIGVQLEMPGPHRLAIYEQTYGDRGRSLTGRRDF